MGDIMKQALSIGGIWDIQERMRGFQDTIVYYLVALYGLPDAVAERPRTVEDLASDLELDYEYLLDLFTYLMSVGLFSQDEDGTITNTAASEIFRKDDPSQMWYLAQFFAESVLPAWQNASNILKTGSNPSRDTFSPATERSDRLTMLFNGGMTAIGLGRDELAAILNAFDFSQFSTVIDIGGGKGDFVQRLYDRGYPNQQVAIFDQPKTETNMITSPGIRRFLGDFLKTIPEGFDLYFWKRVFHDFADEQVVQLLKLNRDIAPSARVMICEMILKRDGIPSIEKMWTLLMRNVTAGKERTLENWEMIIEMAGYQLVEVVPTASPMNLIFLEAHL
ncbi:MAG: hypothetical protein IIC83_13235 [Chloroflexi bacterium]|nr:hypothetical protein [Chloroflexota bacterium]